MISQKMQYLFGAMRAAGVDQTSNRTFEELASALPNPQMSPQAIAELTASMIVNNTRAKAKELHMNKYAANSNGFLQKAGTAFANDNPATADMAAKTLIANFMLSDPNNFAAIMNGQLTAQQIDEAFQNSFGVPGMSRYFMGAI